MWYGYVSYVLGTTLILILCAFIVRKYSLPTTIPHKSLFFVKSAAFLILFWLLISLYSINYSMFIYKGLWTLYGSDTSLLYNLYICSMSQNPQLSLNPTLTYTYPFIYIFLIVTALSLLFCLSYNLDELMSFLLYIKVIFFAGYFLLYTNSLIVFFFAYELLLIPSFYILYRYAKTRRCVEAAYLMFF